MKKGRKSAWETILEPRLEEIKGWCRDGYTDKQICEALTISQETFCKYKRLKPELAEALKINKQIADLTVENSLYKRAIGCKVTEIIEDAEYIIGPDGTPRPTGRVKRRKIVKELPPDATSGIFWSKNRNPEKWRDKQQHEITGRAGGPIETVRLSKREHAKIREEMLKRDDC